MLVAAIWLQIVEISLSPFIWFQWLQNLSYVNKKCGKYVFSRVTFRTTDIVWGYEALLRFSHKM